MIIKVANTLNFSKIMNYWLLEKNDPTGIISGT